MKAKLMRPRTVAVVKPAIRRIRKNVRVVQVAPGVVIFLPR